MVKRQIVQSGTAYMRDILEVEISKHPDWWKLVHTSEKVSDGDTRRCFTRVYQLTIHGKPTDFGIKFFYDYRSGQASATFDIVALRVMEHQSKPDFDIDRIDAYINEFIEKHKPNRPWWKYL